MSGHRRKRKALRRPRARLDLIEIALYLADHNINVSDRFLAAAEATMEKIASAPGMGRMREFPNPRVSDLRSCSIRGFENYLIFYRVVEAGIEVVRVLHGARDIDQIFSAE